MALNDFSSRVRMTLLDTLPELAPFAAETEAGVLRVHIPHPRIPSGMVLSTEGNEVTIGFRQWHTHGELLGGITESEHVERAIAFLGAVLAGRMQLVVSYVDGKFDDAWVTDDPGREAHYAQANEELLIGTWAQLAA